MLTEVQELAFEEWMAAGLHHLASQFEADLVTAPST